MTTAGFYNPAIIVIKTQFFVSFYLSNCYDIIIIVMGMNKRDIIEKHMLNRKDLHDYMLKIGLERIDKRFASMYDYEVNENELSKLIYEYIDYITKESKERREVLYSGSNSILGKHEFFENLFYQESFKYVYFFEYENDK